MLPPPRFSRRAPRVAHQQPILLLRSAYRFTKENRKRFLSRCRIGGPPDLANGGVYVRPPSPSALRSPVCLPDGVTSDQCHIWAGRRIRLGSTVGGARQGPPEDPQRCRPATAPAPHLHPSRAPHPRTTRTYQQLFNYYIFPRAAGESIVSSELLVGSGGSGVGGA